MRRRAPRPLSQALDGVVREAEPAGLLPRVQRAWTDVVGAQLAAATRPVSEQNRVVTVSCESSVWAQELALLAPDLVGRLNTSEGPGEGQRIERLRFVVGSGSSDA